jgi:hypothetical protein
MISHKHYPVNFEMCQGLTKFVQWKGRPHTAPNLTHIHKQMQDTKHRSIMQNETYWGGGGSSLGNNKKKEDESGSDKRVG